MKKYYLFLPLIVTLGFVLVFALKVYKPAHEEAVGYPLPAIRLPVLDKSQQQLDTAKLKGSVYALNFFASWCLACQAEQEALQALAGKIPIYGIAWKDESSKVKEWLKEHGNPYRLVGMDPEGKAGIELGITGVPETLLIDAEGKVLRRWRGPVTKEMVLP